MARLLRSLLLGSLPLALALPGAARQQGDVVDIPDAKPSRTSRPSRRPTAKPPRPAAALVGALPAPENRVAILVGADGPVDGPRGATDDARALADALVRNAGFPKTQVVLVASDATAAAEPTRDGILQTIAARPVAADGLLLFYFAGPSVELDGAVYLLPKGVAADAEVESIKQRGISAAELTERLAASGAGQVILALDTARNDPDAEGPPKVVLSRDYARQFSLAGRKLKAHALFLPAAVGQGAYVSSGRRRGYFTSALVEALKGGAATREGEVTLKRLAVFAREWVAQRVRDDAEREQTPDVDVAGYHADDVLISRGYPPPGGNVVAILHTEPDDPDVTAGVDAMAKGDYAAAADAFGRAASRTPDNPHVHVRLSLALQGQRKYPEAASALERAVALDPTKPEWLAELGQLYYNKLDDAERAADAFERGHAIDPSPRMRADLGIASFQVGNRLYAQGRYEEAAAALARARELNARIASDVAPVLARAYSRLGDAHLAAGRVPEAIDAFGKAIETDASNVDAYRGLAAAHMKTGDLAAARGVADRLAAINPSWGANLRKQIDAPAP